MYYIQYASYLGHPLGGVGPSDMIDIDKNQTLGINMQNGRQVIELLGH